MKQPQYEAHVFVCTNRRDPNAPRGSCAARGSEKLRDELKLRCKGKSGWKGRMRVNASGCLDLCEKGIVAVVYPEGRWFTDLTPETGVDVLEKALAEKLGDG